jgi:hypothetical protein
VLAPTWGVNALREAAIEGSPWAEIGMCVLLGAVYLVIGVLVAASNDYLDRLGTIRAVVSALLAIVLWPLVLLGFDVDIRRR